MTTKKFEEYRSAEQAFQSRYGDWLKENRYAALLVESKLREEFDLSQGRRLHEKRKKPLRQYLPTYRSWRLAAYRSMLKTILGLRSETNSSSGRIHFQWHQEKRGSITNGAEKIGLLINRGDASGFAAFQADSMRLQSLVGVSPKIWRIYAHVYQALESGCEPENLFTNLNRIEQTVRREVEYAADLYRKSGVEYMVMGSDQSPYNRLKCEAARLAGIKTAVIGHGYFGSRHLGGVLPVYADRLFVWTELQKAQIHEVIEPEQRHKVVCEGFPYPVNKAPKEKSAVMVALDDISKLDPEGWWRTFDTVISGLLKVGLDLIIRPRRAEDIGLFQARCQGNSIEISRANLYDDFDKVGKVVCGRSSVGVQAVFYGLQAARVEEWSDERYTGEGLPRAPAERFSTSETEECWSPSNAHTDAKALTVEEIVQVLDQA